MKMTQVLVLSSEDAREMFSDYIAKHAKELPEGCTLDRVNIEVPEDTSDNFHEILTLTPFGMMPRMMPRSRSSQQNTTRKLSLTNGDYPINVVLNMVVKKEEAPKAATPATETVPPSSIPEKKQRKR